MTVRRKAYTVTETPVDQAGVPYAAITAYVVHDEADVLLGTVCKVETTSHRKVGRLIAQTFHPIRWVAHEPGLGASHQRRVGYEFYTRAEAVDGLVRHHEEKIP